MTSSTWMNFISASFVLGSTWARPFKKANSYAIHPTRIGLDLAIPEKNNCSIDPTWTGLQLSEPKKVHKVSFKPKGSVRSTFSFSCTHTMIKLWPPIRTCSKQSFKHIKMRNTRHSIVRILKRVESQPRLVITLYPDKF